MGVTADQCVSSYPKVRSSSDLGSRFRGAFGSSPAFVLVRPCAQPHDYAPVFPNGRELIRCLKWYMDRSAEVVRQDHIQEAMRVAYHSSFILMHRLCLDDIFKTKPNRTKESARNRSEGLEGPAPRLRLHSVNRPWSTSLSSSSSPGSCTPEPPAGWRRTSSEPASRTSSSPSASS